MFPSVPGRRLWLSFYDPQRANAAVDQVGCICFYSNILNNDKKAAIIAIHLKFEQGVERRV